MERPSAVTNRRSWVTARSTMRARGTAARARSKARAICAALAGHARARGERDDDHRGRAVAAVAVDAGDLLRGLVARLAGEREVDREAVRDVRGAVDAGREEHEPDEHHEAPVSDHETREPRERVGRDRPRGGGRGGAAADRGVSHGVSEVASGATVLFGMILSIIFPSKVRLIRDERTHPRRPARGRWRGRFPWGPWPGNVSPAPLEGIAASPDSAPAFRSVGFTISSSGYAIARRFRELLVPFGLEPREFALLRAVGAAEGQSQQAIGERLQIPPSRMVAFVDALAERGVLERRQNPTDRRARALYLTDAGRDLLARAFAAAAAFERELCADLSEKEREQLLALLGRVAARLGLRSSAHVAIAHAALADE